MLGRVGVRLLALVLSIVDISGRSCRSKLACWVDWSYYSAALRTAASPLLRSYCAYLRLQSRGIWSSLVHCLERSNSSSQSRITVNLLAYRDCQACLHTGTSLPGRPPLKSRFSALPCGVDQSTLGGRNALPFQCIVSCGLLWLVVKHSDNLIHGNVMFLRKDYLLKQSQARLYSLL